jgi:hypothetical protein
MDIDKLHHELLQGVSKLEQYKLFQSCFLIDLFEKMLKICLVEKCCILTVNFFVWLARLTWNCKLPFVQCVHEYH